MVWVIVVCRQKVISIRQGVVGVNQDEEEDKRNKGDASKEVRHQQCHPWSHDIGVGVDVGAKEAVARSTLASRGSRSDAESAATESGTVRDACEYLGSNELIIDIKLPGCRERGIDSAYT